MWPEAQRGKESGVSGPYSVATWNAIIGKSHMGFELTRHAINGNKAISVGYGK